MECLFSKVAFVVNRVCFNCLSNGLHILSSFTIFLLNPLNLGCDPLLEAGFKHLHSFLSQSESLSLLLLTELFHLSGRLSVDVLGSRSGPAHTLQFLVGTSNQA